VQLLKGALAALAGLTVLALAIGACGSNNDDDIEAINASLQRIETLTALNTMEGVGFHDIAEDLQAASELDTFTLSTIRRARQVAAVTVWPQDLSELAATFLTKLGEFETALEAEDLRESKGLANETHDAWHELQTEAYPYLAGEEPEHEE